MRAALTLLLLWLAWCPCASTAGVLEWNGYEAEPELKDFRVYGAACGESWQWATNVNETSFGLGFMAPGESLCFAVTARDVWDDESGIGYIVSYTAPVPPSFSATYTVVTGFSDDLGRWTALWTNVVTTSTTNGFFNLTIARSSDRQAPGSTP